MSAPDDPNSEDRGKAADNDKTRNERYEDAKKFDAHYRNLESKLAQTDDVRTTLLALERDKYSLYQKLNFHRLVDELVSRRRGVVAAIVAVIVLIFGVIGFEIYSDSITQRITEDYVLIDKTTNDALESKRRLVDTLNLEPVQRAAILQEVVSKYTDLDQTISANYYSSSLLRGFILRASALAVLLFFLGVLIRTYFSLERQVTRFRLMEEATTVVLFYLLKKFDGPSEQAVLRDTLPLLIGKLYDMPGEPGSQKGGTDLGESIRNLNTATSNLSKMVIDVQSDVRNRLFSKEPSTKS